MGLRRRRYRFGSSSCLRASCTYCVLSMRTVALPLSAGFITMCFNSFMDVSARRSDSVRLRDVILLLCAHWSNVSLSCPINSCRSVGIEPSSGSHRDGGRKGVISPSITSFWSKKEASFSLLWYLVISANVCRLSVFFTRWEGINDKPLLSSRTWGSVSLVVCDRLTIVLSGEIHMSWSMARFSLNAPANAPAWTLQSPVSNAFCPRWFEIGGPVGRGLLGPFAL